MRKTKYFRHITVKVLNICTYFKHIHSIEK
jgi:hypothetical protein